MQELLKKVKEGKYHLEHFRKKGFVCVNEEYSQAQLTLVILNILHYYHYATEARKMFRKWSERDFQKYRISKIQQKYYYLAEKSVLEDEKIIISTESFNRVLKKLLLIKAKTQDVVDGSDEAICREVYKILYSLVEQEWKGII